MQWLKQSTAVTVKMGPFLDSTDGNSTEEALTIAQADIRLTKNGGAYAQTNNVAGATHDENGNYGVPLNTTDTNTLGTLRVHIHESGALAVWQDFMVVPANVWDSMFGADKLQTDTVQWLGTACATPTVAGVPEIDLTHLGGVAQSATDLKDFADEGYDPATNKVQGLVLADTVTTLTGHTAQTGDNFARLGVAGAGLTDLGGMSVGMKAEVNAEADTALTDYDGPTKAEMDTAHALLATAAALTTVDGVVDAILVDTADMQPKLGAPAADVSADIAAVKAETALIVADTNELQTDDVPGLIAALNDISPAEVESEVNDALDTAISELGVAAPTATPTIRTALMLMYMALRNKLVVQTSGTDALEVYNNAGTKIAAKLITDAAGDYTEAEMA